MRAHIWQNGSSSSSLKKRQLGCGQCHPLVAPAPILTSRFSLQLYSVCERHRRYFLLNNRAVNAAETQYLYDPSYAPTLDIGLVVHTLNRMFNLNVPPLCARAF